MIKINDISDKGRKENKRLRYEVGVFHSRANQTEEPEIIAKFKRHGDAWIFATHISNGNVWFDEIIIRS